MVMISGLEAVSGLRSQSPYGASITKPAAARNDAAGLEEKGRARETLDVRYEASYRCGVIQSFNDGTTRRLFEDDRRRGFRGLDYDRALVLLDALDAAQALDPLRALQAVRLHALSGPRRGVWAMTINARWRLTFRFADGDAHDVAIEDYHTG